MFVAWNMGEWREFAHLRRFSGGYRTILVGTFVLTVVFDLTVAGWRSASCSPACSSSTASAPCSPSSPTPSDLPPGVQAFELFGSLFFGAVGKIERALPEQVEEGTRAVVLEMHRLVLLDSTGLDAGRQLHRVLKRRDIAPSSLTSTSSRCR